MRKLLTALFLCLAILLGIVESASGKIGLPSEKSASGDFWQNPNISTSDFELLPQIGARENTTVTYEDAMGVWVYVIQNPWSKIDPLGLANVSPDGTEVYYKGDRYRFGSFSNSLTNGKIKLSKSELRSFNTTLQLAISNSAKHDSAYKRLAKQFQNMSDNNSVNLNYASEFEAHSIIYGTGASISRPGSDPSWKTYYDSEVIDKPLGVFLEQTAHGTNYLTLNGQGITPDAKIMNDSAFSTTIPTSDGGKTYHDYNTAREYNKVVQEFKGKPNPDPSVHKTTAVARIYQERKSQAMRNASGSSDVARYSYRANRRGSNGLSSASYALEAAGKARNSLAQLQVIWRSSGKNRSWFVRYRNTPNSDWNYMNESSARKTINYYYGHTKENITLP